MRKMMRSNLLVSLVALALVGCSTSPRVQEDAATSEEMKIAQVIAQMNESTLVAVEAQRDLALTADAKTQHNLLLKKRLLTDVVSYDFYGNVEDLVKEIAMKYGYAFEVYGKRPPEAVVLNVYVANRKAIDVLKHVGFGATNFMDIVVKRDAIQLHYKTK